MEGTQAVAEAGMLRAVVGAERRTQLANAAQALKLGRINQVQQPAVPHDDEAVHGIHKSLFDVAPPRRHTWHRLSETVAGRERCRIRPDSAAFATSFPRPRR